MRRFILTSIFVVVAMPIFAFADQMQDARQQGLDFGTTYKDSGASVITAQNKATTPGYTTENPDQVKYYNGADTSQDAQKAISTTQQGSLMTSMASRPQMTIKPNDPFLNSAQAITGNPDQAIAMLTGTYGECKPITSTQTLTEMRTCDQYTKDCVDPQKMVSVSGAGVFSAPLISVVIPKGDSVDINSGIVCSPTKHSVTTVTIQDLRAVSSLYLSQLSFYSGAVRITVNGKQIYVSDYPAIFNYDGSIDCDGLWGENSSLNHYLTSTFLCGGMLWDCTASPVNYALTPNINLTSYLIKGDNVIDVAFIDVFGYRGGAATFNLTYAKNSCGADAMVNDCSNVPSNCKFQSSKCLAFSDQNICTFTQNLYACSTTTSTTTTQVNCGSDVYCVNGQCTSTDDKQNNDFAKSIAYLQSINQAGKDNNGSTSNINFFNGQSNSCEKQITNYNNCCKDSGWGQDYAGASCKENEVRLAEQQAKKLCHYVGSYCSKKIPLIGTCQTTTKSYCCFNSKISRVIVEQGRAQLGIGWGSGESPDCSGLSTNQMQSLQFDKMDLSEISADIASSAVVPDTTALQSKIKQTVEGYGKTSD